MSYALVDQFRLTRSERRRGLEGGPPAEAQAHPRCMNCIRWIAGGLAALAPYRPEQRGR